MVSRLKKGDLIDILAPGSFIDEEENFQKGIEILKNWGLEINENNSLSKKFGRSSSNVYDYKSLIFKSHTRKNTKIN